MMLFAIFTGHLITQIHFLHEMLSIVGEGENAKYEKRLKADTSLDEEDHFIKSSNVLTRAISLHNEIIR